MRQQGDYDRAREAFIARQPMGRMATRLAGAFAPPYKGRRYLARLNDQLSAAGFAAGGALVLAPSAEAAPTACGRCGCPLTSPERLSARYARFSPMSWASSTMPSS
jgi:hypothetical protein